jgi:hypothetical protein
MEVLVKRYYQLWRPQALVLEVVVEEPLKGAEIGPQVLLK